MNSQITLIIVYSCLLVILLFLSAFFSSADMAYGSVSELRLNSYLKGHNNHRTKTAIKLVKKYDSTISIILFLNDLVNVACETIGALLGYLLFESFNLGKPANGSFIGSVIILVLIIVLGEILPKSITKNNAFKCSLAYANVINTVYYIFYPVAYLTTKLGHLFTLPLRRKKIEKPEVTDEELEEMVDVIEKEGIVDKDNADILRGTIDYASTEAYEIMTPRVDIYAIDIDDSLESIIKNEETYVHSRIPVYRETIDNIIGYVTTKDLIRLSLLKNEQNIQSIIKYPLRFPRSTEINDILQQFRTTKNHFAIVLDEYGGVEGIITMEDILEEIVGEIWDEVDDVNEIITKIGNNTYIVDGKMNLDDFFEDFNINKDEIDTDYVTIGGYCIELLDDHFAKVGDTINFKNLTMKIIAVDEQNTIEKIKVKVKKIND